MKIKWVYPLFLLLACGRSKDFSTIRKGDRAVDLLNRFGTPESKRKMGNAQWWLYNDEAKHILVIDSDTVANVLTQEEAARIMKQTLQLADSLHLK
jgi:hypothetical protein